MNGSYRRKDRYDRDGFHAAGSEVLGSFPGSLFVKSPDLSSVEFVAPGNYRPGIPDGVSQILGQGKERRDPESRRFRDPQKADMRQIFSLDDRVRAVRRPKHYRDDFRSIYGAVLENLFQRLVDPRRNILGGIHLLRPNELVPVVENDGVGVRPANVNADSERQLLSTQLLHRNIIHIVAKVSRPSDLDSLGWSSIFHCTAYR